MSGFARAVLNCGRLVIAMAAAPFRNARRDAAVIEATSPRRSDAIPSVIVDLPGSHSQVIGSRPKDECCASIPTHAAREIFAIAGTVFPLSVAAAPAVQLMVNCTLAPDRRFCGPPHDDWLIRRERFAVDA